MKPENGKRYRIYGSDNLGEWSMMAECKHYKPSKSLSKYQKKWGYRWVADSGEVIRPTDVEEYKTISEMIMSSK